MSARFFVWAPDDGDRPEKPNVTAVDSEDAAAIWVERHHADFDYADRITVLVEYEDGIRSQCVVCVEKTVRFVVRSSS